MENSPPTYEKISSIFPIFREYILIFLFIDKLNSPMVTFFDFLMS